VIEAKQPRYWTERQAAARLLEIAHRAAMGQPQYVLVSDGGVVQVLSQRHYRVRPLGRLTLRERVFLGLRAKPRKIIAKS
jgi:hypothetical protein